MGDIRGDIAGAFTTTRDELAGPEPLWSRVERALGRVELRVGRVLRARVLTAVAVTAAADVEDLAVGKQGCGGRVESGVDYRAGGRQQSGSRTLAARRDDDDRP